MTRITTVINQKGGVGKTTTAHALAGGLNLRGRRALLVDTDPQGNASYTMGIDPARPSLYEALRGEAATADAIHDAAGRFDARVFETVIRKGVAVHEAQTQRRSLYEGHAASNPTKDYLVFVDEYLAQEGMESE